jgi:hypothetical protein
MAQPEKPNFISLNVKGLFLNPSTFGDNVPVGALTLANNVVIDRPSVVATRRGFNNEFTNTPHVFQSLFQYNGIKLAYDGLNMYYDVHDILPPVYPYPAPSPEQALFEVTAGQYYTPSRTVNPAINSYSGSRIRGVELANSFYYITSVGTYKTTILKGLSAIVEQPRLACPPPALSGTYTIAAGTVIPSNTKIAYRVVFGYIDINNQLILGAPSDRIVVTNSTGAAADATLTIDYPIRSLYSDYLGDSFFCQIYRGSPTANLLTEPDDEMSLVAEVPAASVVSPSFNYVDNIAQVSLGAALYTNQGQQGILQANYPAPHAQDVCLYKQYAYYANTQSKHYFNTTLIKSGSGAGALVSGDTIQFVMINTTLAQPELVSFTLTAGASNNYTTGTFQVTTDEETTAKNIVSVVNNYIPARNLIVATYASTIGDQPGQISFEAVQYWMCNDIGATAAVTCQVITRTTAWQNTAYTLTDNVTYGRVPSFTQDINVNRVYFSKFNQPHAVPLVNYIDVGSSSKAIRRIIPLRDGVMVLKDDGVFRISNAAPPFVVTPIDYKIQILAPNTASELDNKVYFLSDQGVVALGDNSSEVMSFVLDKTIIENTSTDLYPNLAEAAWGVAYQSARKYILSMPTTGFQNAPSKQYVWNHYTQVWTTWSVPNTLCGIIFSGDGKMYIGNNDGYVLQERKAFTAADYADNQYTVRCMTTAYTDTITFKVAASLPYPIFNYPIDVFQPGQTVVQYTSSHLKTQTAKANILTVTSVGDLITITTDSKQYWEASSAPTGVDGELTAPLVIYNPIYSEVQTIQMDCQNPAMNKQFTEIVYLFTEQGFRTLQTKISSNTSAIPAYDTLLPARIGGWGYDPWGDSPWGGATSSQGKVRRMVPQSVQRAGWLYIYINHKECFESFGWSGAQLYYKNTSTRQK